MKALSHKSLLAALEAVFPSRIGVASLPISGAFPVEFPEEEVCVVGANAFRRQEFLAGRFCAREAMGKLGLPALPILAGEKRGPVWPSGIIGSISHTREHCVAAIALEGEFRSIGLDMEQHKRLKPNLWRLVLTKKELEWINGIPESERISMAALVFSAKEAFYKYQFPLTQVWLGFQDAEVELSFEDGTFVLKILKDVLPEFSRGGCTKGRFAFYEDYVLAGIS